MKRLLAIICFLFIQIIFAQGPGCPNVNAGPSQIDLDCVTPCTNLTATFLETGETTSYTVSSIPFGPPSNFTGLANPIFVNTDDIWSPIINIPFDFCFFGDTFNQLVLGANGVISFDTSLASGFNAWQFNTPLPTNTDTPLSNGGIFGAAHDVDPRAFANDGTQEIGWEVKGSAPCRTFVMSYYNIAQFSCNNLKTTQMVVLYEGTNAIEVHIFDKPTCFGWNNGNATIGIQNDAGTVAYWPPGRNTGNWSATIESWRFTPSGTPNYNLTWYDGSNTAIATTPTINVCPTADEIFTVEVEYTNCDGTVFSDSDSVLVTTTATEDPSFSVTSDCDGGTATIIGDPGGTFAFNPPPGDGATINATTGVVTNGTPGATYTIEYTTPGSCAATTTQSLTVPTADDASFTMAADCDGGTATITGTTGGTFVFNPVPGDGAILDATTGTVTGGTPGATYTIEYTTSGTCPASSTQTVTVQSTGDASFTMTATCDGGTATITGDSGGTFIFNPVPGDGATINTTTGLVTGGTSGTTYTIEYTTGGSCSATSTQTVTVLTTDDASFTTNPSCDGGTATITGTTGGTFTFNPLPGDGAAINATTGTVTSGISGSTYTIEYTTNGACPVSSTQTVTVLSTGDASFTMTATCDGGTASIIGSTGGTFTFNPLPGDGATINPTTGVVTSGTPGTTYTIEYTTTGSCAATSTETVTVLPSEDASFTMTANCDGGTATITGNLGGTFIFNPLPGDGATINATTGSVTLGTSGTTYTIDYTTGGSCSATSTQTVTVLTTDDASFIMTATCDGGTATISGTTGGTFTFNPLPGDGAAINATTGTVTSGVSGSTYTIEYTTSGVCPASSTQTVTVLPSEDASFTMTATCDGGTATISGDTGGTFTFNPLPGDGATIDATTGAVTSGISGSTYTIEYTTSGVCPANSSQAVTVLPSEDATFSMTATCDGGTATITGNTGGTFTFNPAPGDGATLDAITGAVTVGTSGTTYTIDYTTGGSCSATSTQTVTVLTTDDASFTTNPSCDGGTATITGTTGGTFTFNPVPGDGAAIDATTGTITSGISGSTYTIEYTTSGVCPVSSTQTVTVLSTGDASFTMTATCDGGTASIIGSTGGTFTFNPLPGDGATLDGTTGVVTSGTPGATYTIEYTTTGSCAATSTETITVLPSEDATFSMTATCDGGTATITGNTGGTFIFNPVPGDGATINATTGSVTLGTSGTTYTIEYTTGGSCSATSTQTVTVLTTDDASFTTNPNCDGGTATISGTPGGTFTFNPVPGDGAAIDVTTGTITSGISGSTYTIEYTTSGVCPASSTQTVTVLTTGDASFAMTATCDGGTASIIGSTGGTFTFNPLPGDGATIDATIGAVTGGTPGATYTIEYTITGSCSATSTETVTVLPSEDASFSVIENCEGGTMTIIGDTGGIFSFNPDPADGANIDITTGEVTNGMSGVTYVVEYITSGACAVSSAQNVTVLATDDPSFTMTATCDGGIASITGTTSGTFAFNPAPSDSATIDTATGIVINGTSGATYTIDYITSGVCPANSTQTVTVLITDDSSFTMAATCDGGTATITGTTGGSFTLNPAPGDGAAIDATTGELTSGTPGTTYTVEYITPGVCPANSTQTVTVHPSEDASFTVTANCDGATATIIGDTGGIFSFNPTPSDAANIDSTSGEITNGTSGATYTVEYITSGLCAVSSMQNVTVLIIDNPAFTVTPDCDGGTVAVTGTTGGAFAFNPAPGDGAAINSATGEVTNGISGTTYTLEYITNGTCPESSTQNLTVLTTDNPSFTMTDTCDGGTASINGTIGGTFTFSTVPGDGATIDSATGEIANGTSGTTYTIDYTTNGTCPASSIETVTVLPSEDPSFTMDPDCNGGTATISGDTGGMFTFNPIPGDGANIDSTSGEVTNGVSGATYIIEYTTSGPCTISSTQNLTIIVNEVASFTMTPNCDGATAALTGTTGGVFTFDVDPADGSVIDSATGEVTNAVSGSSYSVLYTTTGTCMDSQVETFTVHPSPIVDIEDNFNLCIDNDGNIVDIVLIETGLSIADYSFEWTETSSPTVILGTDSFYEPTQAGTYSVLVTDNITFCSTVLGDPNTISVVTNTLPPSGLSAIILSETFANENVIEASVDNVPGDTYEFNIDGGLFEGNGTNSFIFNNVSPGEHVITVINGCGNASTTVFMVDYPLFFTPNNDGYNDSWQVIGIRKLPDAKIYIFDRYGKLLKQLSPTSIGWDGTLNGLPLPSSDYWFLLEFRNPNDLSDTSKKEFKAHFTLKR